MGMQQSMVGVNETEKGKEALSYMTYHWNIQNCYSAEATSKQRVEALNLPSVESAQ